MGYWTILLVYTIIAANNGQSGIWTTSVSNADFNAREKRTEGQVHDGGPAYGVQQQQAYYPAQQPQMSGGTYPPPPNV